MEIIIILGWLYLCSICFSIMMIIDYCPKDEIIWCIPWFILGPIWILICWFIVRPLIRKTKASQSNKKK